MIKWKEMEAMLKAENDTVYVFNFWATWCKPCVEELPEFHWAEQEMKLQEQKVKFIYVSMDFAREFESRFLPFVEKNMAGKTVYLLNEPDYDSWISKVDDRWMGEIPATLIVRNQPSKRYFHSTQLDHNELLTNINQLLK